MLALRHYLPLGVATACAVALSVPAQAAEASSPGPSVAAIVQSATPATVANVSGSPLTQSGLETHGVDATTSTLPKDPSQGVALAGAGKTMTVSLPQGSKTPGKQVAQGMVDYPTDRGYSTAAVAVQDGSVQLNTVIQNSKAPRSYTYEVRVAGGENLEIDQSTGGVTVTDAQHRWVGAAAPAWARDAKGTPVKTWYEVSGNRLTQHVDLSQPGIVFPVVADPYWGKALIDHTRWANTWKFSPTLQVFPTTWGRVAPAWAEGAAWTETLQKTARKGHPSPSTASMHVQFSCHWQAVRIRSPRKPSWDLDSKLPNTSLLNEINHGCNYGSGAKGEF